VHPNPNLPWASVNFGQIDDLENFGAALSE
jgi:hypothetical protein